MAQTSVPAAVKTAAATISTSLAVEYRPVLIVIAVILGAIVTGVVLPAVWSAKPARRAAALAVLQQILNIIRHSEHSGSRSGRGS